MQNPHTPPGPLAQPLRGILCLVLLALMGCELADKARDALVESHQETARGRVGVLRALELHDSAASTARAISLRGDARCGGPLEGPFEASIEIEAEVVGRSERVIDRFTEIRRVRRDATGNVSARFTVIFMDPSGRRGETTREVRIVGERRYVREQNLPFVAHRRHKGDSEAFVREAMDAIPAALSAGGANWRASEDGREDVFVSDTESDRETQAFECGLDPHQRAWLRRLMDTATVSFAEAIVPDRGAGDRTRSVSARLMAGDEHKPMVVRLDVEERVQYGEPEAIAAPDKVADLRRDRPYHDIELILEKKLGLHDWHKK